MIVEDLKKRLNKWFVIAIIGLISLVFVFVGVFPAATSFINDQDIATVAGESISLAEFQKAYDQQMKVYKQFADKMPPLFMKQLRDQIVNNLIQNRLILLEARRMGFSVSSEEVRKTIEKQAVFHNKEKRFDVDKYKNLLAANRFTPGSYEKLINESLVQSQLLDFLRQRIRVTDQELRQDYQLKNSKRDLEYVHIRNEDAYKKMKISTKEIKDFLKIETKLNLAKENYKTNIHKYKKSPEVCARHILSKSKGKKPTKKFLGIQPLNAKNFAKLARKHSEGPTKSKGGDLGCFGTGVMDKNFEASAFALKTGGISKPVKSSFGWHYIYTYKKIKGFEKKFEKVEKEIAKQLIKKSRFAEVRKINRKTAQGIMSKWKKGQKKSLKLKTTGLFTKMQPTIPNIGNASEIMTAAFNNKAPIQKGPQLFEAAGGIIVAQVKKKMLPDFAKMKRDKEKQSKTLIERKYRTFLDAWMKELRENFSVSINQSLIEKAGKI